MALVEQSATDANTIINIKMVATALGTEGTTDSYNRIGMRRTDDELRVAAVGIVGHGTTIIINDTTTGIDGVGARGFHIVGARSDVDRTFPETLFRAAIGAKVSLIATTGIQVVANIEGVGDCRDDIGHAVDRSSHSVVAQLPHRSDVGRVPSHHHAVGPCERAANEIAGTGAVVNGPGETDSQSRGRNIGATEADGVDIMPC